LKAISEPMQKQEEIIKRFDWDYLIGLDACRADSFEQYNKLEGSYERVETPKGDTIAWYNYMFPAKYSMRLYSASPLLRSKVALFDYFAGAHFRKVYDIWDTDWNEERQTTLPESVYEYAREAPKKSIIWFEQPHFPPINEKDKDLWPDEKRLKTEGGGYLLTMIFTGKISAERVKQAHFNNVKAVMPWVEKLVSELEGKILITADHGELLGETYAVENGIPQIGWLHSERVFGAYRPKELYTVPMLVIEK